MSTLRSRGRKRDSELFWEASAISGRVKASGYAVALFFTEVGVWRITRADRMNPHEFHSRDFAGVYQRESVCVNKIHRNLKMLDRRKYELQKFGIR